jgi:two-component system OmpR family sensor kinase
MWRPLSFRARLALQWTVAFGLLLAVADAVIYVGVRSHLYGSLDGQVRTLAATELASSVDSVEGVHLHDLPMEVGAGGALAEKLVQIYDAEGRVLLQSALLGGAGPIAALQSSAARASDAAVLAVTANGRPARIVVLPMQAGRARALAAGLFTDGIEAALARLARLLFAVWFVALAVTGALGHALTSAALRRVERITERAASISRGNFAARLDPPAVEDELGRMTGSINQVLERLHAAVLANRRFAADASHELRGPMTAMAGEIDVALKRDRPAAEYRETLGIVRQGLDTLMAVTSDLMTLVRAQESRGEIVMREVPLGELIDGSVRRVEPLVREKRVRLHVDAAAGRYVAYGEPRLLARVFDNVLTNAVRYNREGGEVAVSCSIQEAAPDAWQPGMITVLVRDSGCGVPEAERDRVFERFYRVDRSRARQTGGTGLGLAICREVLDVLGGSIRIAESSAQGTTVEVRMPGFAAAPEPAASAARPREASAAERG